ncbi:MAG: FAD-dependent oxidoreductase [Fretibacterium sp.]|nr:FAD-dependent oxidoreductase [Oscillospiraceae bacterium]MBQ9526247.1 FAD-dependent oxidoreductase [Fretibacterium sp.]
MAYDVIVIGGGPAGLSAAVNVRARGRSVLVVSNPMEESPLWKAELVDNYLGLPGLSGAELLERFRAHAEQAGAEVRVGRVLNALAMGDDWFVSIGSDVESAKAIVLAGGVTRAKKFPGEAEFLGKGVSYCATCDGMLYRGRSVAVVGYSDSAKKEAEFLTSIGCTVRYFDRPKKCEIQGGDKAERVICDGQEAEADCVFLLRPAIAPTDMFPGIAVENGYVQVDRNMATNLPGVFAAGDCTGLPLQIANAVGDGLIAGQSAAKYAAGLAKKK